MTIRKHFRRRHRVGRLSIIAHSWGTLVTGLGKDAQPRRTYLYHVVDNEWSMREYGSQAVVSQTAVNPVAALELLESGAWKGTGVVGPEAFPARPFLDKLAELGAPHGILDLEPAL